MNTLITLLVEKHIGHIMGLIVFMINHEHQMTLDTLLLALA